MLKYEDFPKKCLICKRTDIPLEKYEISNIKVHYSEGHWASKYFRSIYNSYSTKFPICVLCKKRFKKYQNFSRIFLLFLLFSIITAFLTITFIFFNPQILIPFILPPFFVFLVLTIVFLLIIRKNPDKISNYIEIGQDGKIIIKDIGYEQELHTYGVTKVIEDKLNINKINCPNCNALINKDSDFCKFCGKDLRKY